MCTISNAFEDNDLVSWKKENWSKIMSGKLWHSTLKWSCTHVESLTSCAIILQNLPQGPTCCWLHPQIPDLLKQKEPWCGRSCNQPDGREVEIAKIPSTLLAVLAQHPPAPPPFCTWRKLRSKEENFLRSPSGRRGTREQNAQTTEAPGQGAHSPLRGYPALLDPVL